MKRFIEYVLLTIGAMISAVAIDLILSPNNLVDGGVTALSIMGNELFGLPVYVLFISLNLPILLFTSRTMGKKFAIRTLYANLVATGSMMFLKQFPPITSSELLIVLYGGLLFGLGVGIVVRLGGAIDGLEMLAVWVNKNYGIAVSTILLSANAIILIAVAIVFSLEQAMFSLAIFYIVTKMIDLILDGFNQGKSVMIISDKAEAIGQELMKELNLSITYLHGEGGYKGDAKKVIYCITSRVTYSKLKDTVLEIDPSAILEASHTAETTGLRVRETKSEEK
ncbi:hypothetical protein BACERE00183_04489 [Bacillus cereus]|nr:hypothetical protein BACERE00183_04489 [Bacillus cereus]